VTQPVLELTDVSKAYGGLRPLRIQQLKVAAGERVSILGFDQPMAEVFVNLVTGATLPDRGTVAAFGRPTSAIVDSAEWLTSVDRFGIVSDRAVLLEGMTVLQNLALPYTLDIEPPADDTRMQAERLAQEVGLPVALWSARIADLDGAARVAVRIARALALDPPILLLEHPTAMVDRAGVAALGSTIHDVSERRSAAVVALTVDQVFADSLSGRTFQLEPATGRLTERGRNRWFRRSLG
jgi:ABC-type transporter Mla maintaining outer membrane lipid asymmetry ATPase subunit MlaF